MNKLFHAITELNTAPGPLTGSSTLGPEQVWAHGERWQGMERILILDGNARSALAATRSLGRRGIPVVVADKTKRTLAGSSKYCSDSFTYPSPSEDLRSFLSTVKAECSRRGIRVIFPMTDISMAAMLKHREEFKDFQLPFAGFPAFDALTDKWNLMRLAQRLNVTVRQTHYIRDALSLQRVVPTLKFPVVLKPCRSMIWENGHCTAASVKYAESVRELEKTVAQHDYFSRNPFLLQEYVTGH